MPPSVDAVFFDLYGTLVDLAALDRSCDEAVPGRGAELAARWRARQLEATWLRNSMGRWADFADVTSETLAVAAAELGVKLDSAAAQALIAAWRSLPARDGVTGLLDRLDAAGVPSGVLTNGSAAMSKATVDGAGLARRFRWLLSVDAVRLFKPAPAVYAIAVDAAGAPPDRIGFVTANGWDAAGAAAFGFRVAWLRPGGAQLPAVGRLEPVPATVALGEVAGLFGA